MARGCCGSTLWTVRCLLLVLATQIGLGYAGLPSDWCASRQGYVYVRHPTDCASYVSCISGDPVILRCQPGLLFDAIIQVCNYPERVHCERPQSPSGTAHSNPRQTVAPPTQREATSDIQNAGWSRPASRLIHSVHRDTVRPPTSSRNSRRGHQQERHDSRDIFDGRSHSIDRNYNRRQLEQLSFDEKYHLIERELSGLISWARNYTHEHFHRQSLKARTMRGHQRAFRYVQSFLGNLPTGHAMAISARQQLEFTGSLKAKYSLNNHDIHTVMTRLGRIPKLIKRNTQMVQPDMEEEDKLSDEDTCPFSEVEVNGCKRETRYRTIDGSCNNLRRPLWGRSMRPLQRELPPRYDDGVGAPRVTSQDGQPLTSPREASVKVMNNAPHTSSTLTVMHMTFGQLLDHDLARTAMTQIKQEGSDKLVDIECGRSGCDTEGVENEACFPIPVPRGDRDFGANKKCLMFVRSQEVLPADCTLNPREQLNQVTSYLDASFVYGNFPKDARALRDTSQPNRGKLQITPNPNHNYKGLLPQINNPFCRDVTPTVRCFRAGDTRANEQVGLAAIHTVFHRYHNHVEERLHNLNPKWNGERLYQESRRIVGAIWQHIVYNEYLPPTLGDQNIRRYALGLQTNGFYDAYDPTVNVDTGNAFQTAAFRFGHSQISDTFKLADQSYKFTRELNFSQIFDRPTEIYNNGNPAGSGVDAISLGQISQEAFEADSLFSSEVTARLFSENPPHKPGTDLVSLNTQRGRDHGLQGYPAWRRWCGLSVPTNFQSLTDIPTEAIRKLRSVYRNVNDIDLFIGAMSETPLRGALVGPTFACVIGRQFRKFRVGDRFWYERNDPVVGFNIDQLTEIRKMTLARIMCDSLDHVDHIQKFVMLQPFSSAIRKQSKKNYGDAYALSSLYHGEQNERRPCSQIPDIDLSAWRAEPTTFSSTAHAYSGTISGDVSRKQKPLPKYSYAQASRGFGQNQQAGFQGIGGYRRPPATGWTWN